MVVIQKPLQVVMKEKGIVEPREIEKVKQQCLKYKDMVDTFYNEANVWVRDGMTDSQKQETLKKKYFELESSLEIGKYAGICSYVYAWKMEVLSSYIFTKGDVHASISMAANPAIDMPIGSFEEKKSAFEYLEGISDKIGSFIMALSSSASLQKIANRAGEIREEFASYMGKKTDKKYTSRMMDTEILIYGSEFEFFKDHYISFGISESGAEALAKQRCKSESIQVAGLYSSKTNTLRINLERLKKDNGSDYLSQVWVTVAHELAHSLGGFKGRYHDMDTEVFNDAICEHIADDFVRNGLKMDFNGNSYTRLMNSICWKLFGLVGEEKVFEAYVNKDISIIQNDIDEAVSLDPKLEDFLKKSRKYLMDSECVHFRCFAALMTEELENTNVIDGMARHYARIIARRIFSDCRGRREIEEPKLFFPRNSISDDEAAIRAGLVSINENMEERRANSLPIYFDPYFISTMSAQIATEYKLDGRNLADTDKFIGYLVDALNRNMDPKSGYVPLREKFMAQTSLDNTERYYGASIFDYALLYLFLDNGGVLPKSIREIDLQIRRFIKKTDYSRFGPFTDALVEETFRKTLNLVRIKMKESSSIDRLMTDSDLKNEISSRYGLNSADIAPLVALVREYARHVGVEDMARYYPQYAHYSKPSPWEILGIMRAAVRNIAGMMYMPPVEAGGSTFYGSCVTPITGPMLKDYFNIAVEENRIHQNVKTATFCSASAQLYIPMGFTGTVEL